MEKIAQTLDVPMQMLFPIDTCTPEGIATLLLNMQLQFGSMEIVEVDGSVSLKFPKNEFSKNATDTLHTVKQLLDKITWDDGVDLTAELLSKLIECEKRDSELTDTIQKNKEEVNENIAEAEQATNVAIEILAKKVRYAYWIAGGSAGLAIVELILLLMKVL